MAIIRLKNLTPRKRFSLMLIIIYIISLPIISTVTYLILKQNAIRDAYNAGKLHLSTMEATKHYVADKLRPVLQREMPGRFIVEGMSRSYVAGNIAETVHQELPQYKYKNASLNPRNPKNKADEFEAGIINKFRENKELKEWRSFRSGPDGKYYVIARVGAPFSADCLRCHGDPAAAPEELIKRYGPTAGLNMIPGDIVDAIVVYIPIHVPLDSAKKVVAIFIGVYTIFFSVIFLVIDVRFRWFYEKIDSDKKKIEEINTEILNLNRDIEAIAAERTMNEMALRVADRVRNPATVIGGLCHRLLEKEKVPEPYRGKLEDILTKSQELEKIVRDFESLMKSKRFMFKRDDLNEIVLATASLMEQEIKDKGIKLSIHLSDTPLLFNANKQLLKVAINHILRNALESTPSGGKISLSTSIKEDNIFLTISDTGIGIPPEDMHRIFEPFFTTKERIGMGLPLVKQIVEDHMGHISVDSIPKMGTTFHLIFPVRWTEQK